MKNTKIFKNTDKNLISENDNFVKIISELKIPVCAQINALNSFLTTTNSKINTKEKELIELTLNSCKSIQNFIDVFLIANKTNSDNFFLEYEEFDFIELIKEIVSEFQIFLKYCSIRAELNMPEKLVFCADKSKIKKILKNLILNNINAAFKNSKLTITVVQKKYEIDFQIKTNSKYIEPFIIDEIFNKDKKYNSQYSKPIVSLGLYTISKIIYAHFGNIYAKSYPNNTNIFGFSLPLNNVQTKINAG